jgi:PRTRC genetic system protein C
MDTTTGIKNLPRKFRYEGLMLDDVDPVSSPEEILAIYQEHYPALVNAAIEGPELTEDAIVYKFATKLGTKGAKTPATPDYALMNQVVNILLGDDAQGDEYELPPSEALEIIA